MTPDDLLTLSDEEFEQYISDLYQSLGYSTERRGKSRQGDQGVDVEARRRREYLVIQCKRYTGSVAFEQVRALAGVVSQERATKGILITTGKFSKKSHQWVKTLPKHSQVELIGPKGIKKLQQQIKRPMRFTIPMPSLNPLSWLASKPARVEITKNETRTVEQRHPATKQFTERKTITELHFRMGQPTCNATCTIENDILRKRSTINMVMNTNSVRYHQVDEAIQFQQYVNGYVKKNAKYKVV